MIKTINIKMKSLDDIESTFTKVEEWHDSRDVIVKPHKEIITIIDGMLECIAGKELEVFKYQFQTYDYNYWHEVQGDSNGHNKWVNYHILKEWVCDN